MLIIYKYYVDWTKDQELLTDSNSSQSTITNLLSNVAPVTNTDAIL